ncbi:AraC family transcriptional regulator [Jiangella aurantiaca]|uniref:AraC family transcriptional regulator n=1 Tax=Jiangella aurantiaca TaxID=2530373 RepID=A0A4R5AH19_9ACTN|nr:AraC family transcriptional regulator [Jiangella aurantiaca]TDD70710.1 AraC family transcriptional regulator [Jiangella aurantiaca]
MTTVPLDRYPLFTSHDLDHARDVVGRIFTPHRLDLLGRSTELSAQMNTRRIERVAANYITYGGDVLIQPGELGSFFVVQVPLSGRSLVRYGGEELLSTPDVASVISPTVPLTQRWSADCAQLILRVERSALEAHLRTIIEAPLPEPIRFEPSMDVRSGSGRRWLSVFRLLVDELDRPDDSLINWQVVAAEYEDWLMTGLLRAQPNNYSELLDAPTRSPVPHRAVSIARDYIESHPEWRHTVTSLAKEARVGVRALQIAFRQHMGTTPRAYLTQVRMQRAHEELLAAQRDMTTVNSVVARWGLGHPGRFARAYYALFGELPSETLAR